MNQPKPKHESRVVVICRKLGQCIQCVARQVKQFVERAEEVLIALVEKTPGVRTLKKALEGWAEKHPVDAHELCVAVTVGLVILATWIAPPLGLFLHLKVFVAAVADVFFCIHTMGWPIIKAILIVFSFLPTPLFSLPTWSQMLSVAIGFCLSRIAAHTEPGTARVCRNIKRVTFVIEKVIFHVDSMLDVLSELFAVKQTQAA